MVTTSETNQPTIAERVAQLHQGLAGQMPASVLDAFGADQAQLQAGGVPAGVAGARRCDAPMQSCSTCTVRRPPWQGQEWPRRCDRPLPRRLVPVLQT